MAGSRKRRKMKTKQFIVFCQAYKTPNRSKTKVQFANVFREPRGNMFKNIIGFMMKVAGRRRVWGSGRHLTSM